MNIRVTKAVQTLISSCFLYPTWLRMHLKTFFYTWTRQKSDTPDIALLVWVAVQVAVAQISATYQNISM